MAKTVITLEEFNELDLPEKADRNAVAKSMGLKLPKVIPSLNEQLDKAKVKAYKPKATKKNPDPVEGLYVTIPSLKIDANNGTRNIWVRAKVARLIATRMLELCDDNDL